MFACPPNPYSRLLENNLGIGEAGQEAIAYVAGFTLPLTIGITIIMFSILKGWHRRYELEKQIMIATVILVACGFASWIFHLGLPPLYGQYISGPPRISIPLYVISAYLNSYGIELMICSLAIGTGVALQLERWQHGKD